MIERRTTAIELRAAGRRLEGHAAVFNVEAQLPGFTEVLIPSAFSASLRSGGDVLALVDHDPSKVLARTRSGTLRLSEDARGLRFDFEVPDTQPGRDVLVLAERGDLGGMSFAFTVPEGGENWRARRRELRAVNLIEVSVVSAWPCYPGTSVVARARPPVLLALALRYLETC
jgi:uncharacterized protein